MHILVYSVGTKATSRKAAVHYAVHSLSRGNLKKIFFLESFTFVCQLYCCSSKHNNKNVIRSVLTLRITFNSCKTVSTSSMTLATVNIDNIIKVTSASSYVLKTPQMVTQTRMLLEPSNNSLQIKKKHTKQISCRCCS